MHVHTHMRAYTHIHKHTCTYIEMNTATDEGKQQKTNGLSDFQVQMV